MKKFNEKTTFNNEQSKKLMAFVLQYGSTCKAQGRAEKSHDRENAREWKAKAATLLDEIQKIASQMDYTAYDGPEEFDESGSETDGWFNEIGELTPPDWAIDEFGIDPDKSPLPEECVRACSHPGRVDDDVSVWVDELKFDQNFPVERARRWLREYGAWDEEELAKMDARELAEKALWIFACDISDGETYCTMDA